VLIEKDVCMFVEETIYPFLRSWIYVLASFAFFLSGEKLIGPRDNYALYLSIYGLIILLIKIE
jgi:hypothetical protein